LQACLHDPLPFPNWVMLCSLTGIGFYAPPS
jgi:hypothetical protein